MRAVGRTDPNTRRELRFLCTAASCTLSAPAVVPPHKLIIDHTSPTRPRGPRVQKTTAVGRSAERAHAHHVTAALPLALDSHRAGAGELSNPNHFQRPPARSCAPGYAGRIVASAVLAGGGGGGSCGGPSGASAADLQGAPLGGADASSQLGQRNSTSEACRCQMCVAFECGCPSRTPPS